MTIDSPASEKTTAGGALAPAMDSLATAGIELDLEIFPLPFLISVSGLYQWRMDIIAPTPLPIDLPVQPIPIPFPEPGPGPLAEEADTQGALLPIFLRSEDLRLDVDGRYPQMTASGTLYGGFTTTVHWIASLRAVRGGWTGSIWYKDGNTAALPYTNVSITATRSWFPDQRSATVTFSGGGAAPRTRTYKYRSAYHHPMEFEYDCTSDSNPVFAINTCAHPNRPGNIACETLSLETVYRRAGFDVKKSLGDTPTVPKALAGSNGTWSDAEMHDAMQAYWSRFTNAAQWSMWVFWAALHDQGSSLGGIMFDDIGPNHRQGTAIFTEAFIKNAPAGDPNPAAWVKRMRFWTAAHEMGHSFNLAHSWQKSHPPQWGTPWIPLANDPEARSFMNYPYNVTGGQQKFFSDFAFRFTNQELLFMRHAPARFVQMGNADWFDNHGFEQAAVAAHPTLKLEVRANRDPAHFEFLEPVVLELKLTNTGERPEVLHNRILESDNLTVILKKQGRRARQWAPYARYCLELEPIVLAPKDSLYQRLPVFAGLNGWDISEPGNYMVQVAADTGDLMSISEPLMLRVEVPAGRDEEVIAQDILTEEVGRTLAMGGSQFLDDANSTLEEVRQRLPDSRIARHAAYAIANPKVREYKVLDVKGGGEPASVADSGGKVIRKKAAPQEALRVLNDALLDAEAASVAPETFGHIGYKQIVDNLTQSLVAEGEQRAAASCQQRLHDNLAARGVLPRVLDEIELRAKALAKSKNGVSAGRR